MVDGPELKIIFAVGIGAHGLLAVIMLIATSIMGYRWDRRGRGLALTINLALLAALYAAFRVDWSVGFVQRADNVEASWIRPLCTSLLLANLGMIFAKFCNLGQSVNKIVKACIGMTMLCIVLSDLFYAHAYYVPWGFGIGFFTASWVIALYHSRPMRRDANINWLGVSRAAIMWIGYGLFGYGLLICQLLSYTMIEVLDTAPHRLNTEIFYLIVCGCGSILAVIAQLIQPSRDSLYSKKE